LIPELQQLVDDVAATIPIEMLHNAAQNEDKHAKGCIKASCGHFEHFLNSMQKRRPSAFQFPFWIYNTVKTFRDMPFSYVAVGVLNPVLIMESFLLSYPSASIILIFPKKC